MASLLAHPVAIKAAKALEDARIDEEDFSPEAIDRLVAMAAARAPRGLEAVTQAELYRVAYARLYARAQVDRAYADRYQALMSDPGPITAPALLRVINGGSI